MFDNPIGLFFFLLWAGIGVLSAPLLLAGLVVLIGALPGFVIYSIITAAVDLWAFTKMCCRKIKSGEARASLKQSWNACFRK